MFMSSVACCQITPERHAFVAWVQYVRGGKEEESIAGVNNLLSFKQNRNSGTRQLSLRVTRRNSPGLWKRMSAQQGASRKRVSE